MGLAVDQIREDHEFIKKSLGILQKIFERSEETAIINTIDLSECIRFNAIFTGMCHNEKEETILFKALAIKGDGVVVKEIASLSAEHRQCGIYIRNLQDLFPEDPHELISPRFMTGIVGYINHMESHIEKESETLFPMVDRYLTISEQETIRGQFNDYEEYVMEACAGTGIKGNIDYLFRKYS